MRVTTGDLEQIARTTKCFLLINVDCCCVVCVVAGIIGISSLRALGNQFKSRNIFVLTALFEHCSMEKMFWQIDSLTALFFVARNFFAHGKEPCKISMQIETVTSIVPCIKRNKIKMKSINVSLTWTIYDGLNSCQINFKDICHGL